MRNGRAPYFYACGPTCARPNVESYHSAVVEASYLPGYVPPATVKADGRGRLEASASREIATSGKRDVAGSPTERVSFYERELLRLLTPTRHVQRGTTRGGGATVVRRKYTGCPAIAAAAVDGKESFRSIIDVRMAYSRRHVADCCDRNREAEISERINPRSRGRGARQGEKDFMRKYCFRDMSTFVLRARLMALIRFRVVYFKTRSFLISARTHTRRKS